MATHRTGDAHRLERASSKITVQHRELSDLEDGVRMAITDRDEIRTESAFVKLEGALEAHFELEERAYYPSADDLDAATAARFRELRADHQQLREDLSDLRDGLKQDGLDGLLRGFTAFAHDLAHHEEREEVLMEELLRGA
ncbi:MAG: hemerythrin domain-containing protein [Myxococcota bacterium]